MCTTLTALLYFTGQHWSHYGESCVSDYHGTDYREASTKCCLTLLMWPKTGHPSVQIPPIPLSLSHLNNKTFTPTLIVSLEVLLGTLGTFFGQQAFEKKKDKLFICVQEFVKLSTNIFKQLQIKFLIKVVSHSETLNSF